MHPVRLAVVAVSFGLVATVKPARAQTDGLAVRGAELAALWCAQCHATGRSAQATDAAPGFPTIARTRSDDEIRGILATPHMRAAMPPFELTTTGIEDIVAYLQTLR